MRANLKFISALPQNADAIKVPAAVGTVDERMAFTH